MMHSHLTYHISVLDTLLRLPLSSQGSNGRCINSTCAWPLRLPRTAPRACTPQRYLRITSSMNGVSAEGICDHKSGTSGERRRKRAKMVEAPGAPPRARDENGGKFALSIVFRRKSALRAVAGRLKSGFWWLTR